MKMRTLQWWLVAVACIFPILFESSLLRAQAPSSQPALNDIENQIRSSLPELKQRDSGTAAVEKLQALRDEKVLRVFKRIAAGQIYLYKDQYVVAVLGDTSEFRIYDLLVTDKEDEFQSAVPIATIPKEELPESMGLEVARPVRRLVVDSLRVLGLKINDPVVRIKAAKELGIRRQEDALEELRSVAANDVDAQVRHNAREAISLIVVASTDTKFSVEQKIEAVRSLGDLKSISSLDLLKEQQKLADISPEYRTSLGAVIGQIESHATFSKWLQNIFSSISLGSIYVLLALGLAITFGLMGVINMAHGEMMMIGGVTTWACYEFVGKWLALAHPALFDWYYVLAAPASFVVAALIGLLIETTVVRFLYKRPLDSLLATIGISYILIQAVRLWKGDNLGMRGPSWANGNYEIFQDVVLPYNRIFLIGLTIFCILSVIILFRYTKIGLMIRATVQNREMAQSLGVNTRLVDMFTFAFGAGLAGLAGYGIVLTSNPTPEMGQTFIVKSFLTVVVGGVGKILGVILSGLSLGFIEKTLEPIVIFDKPIHLFDATWSQVAALIAVVLFMQRKPSGLFPDKGRAADQADRISMPYLVTIDRKMDWLLGLVMIFIGLVIVPMLYVSGLMSLEFVNKLGYIITFAICAIGLDLIWGYIGVLSLCQFMFFAIGGYCMGLYLVNYGPMDGEHHNIPRALYVVMSAVSGAQPPWFLDFFKSFPITVLLGLLLPGILALLIGVSTFRSRVRGVYFSILTQAITTGCWLIFQKNEIKLGGTNGLTNFTHILGYSIQADASEGALHQTRFWLYVISFVVLMFSILIAKILVNSGFGRVLVAIRDDETRLRFVGYQTWAYKALAFVVAALFAAIGGMLYVPQKGIITPHQIAAGASILVVAWVAVGGRGSLWGSLFGAIFVSLLYEFMTSYKPEYWLYTLGGLFVIVPLLFPGGLMSIPSVIQKAILKRLQVSNNVTLKHQPGGLDHG